MMSSQTGEGKADKGAELVPPAERTKTHTGPNRSEAPRREMVKTIGAEQAN